MKNFTSQLPQRKSIRLKGYNYSQAGFYFITIVTQNRENLFGEIKNGKMILNDAGQMAKKYWFEIPNHFPNTQLHEYIVMPNHIHGIIEITIVGANNHSPEFNANNHSCILRANNYSPLQSPQPVRSPFRSPSKTIGSIIRGYKIGVTKHAKQIANNWGWQSRYHDHIIRNIVSFDKIRNYIINNPQKWANDKFYNG